MSRLWTTLLVFILALGLRSTASACEWTCNGSGNAIPLTGIAGVRCVFIAFSDTPYGDNLPTWTNEFVTEMEEYYAWATNGNFLIDLEVLTPPGQPGKAWLAPNPASAYRHECGDPTQLDTSDLNAWIIEEIYNQLGTGVWNGVHSLYITYIGNPFGCGVPIPRAVATLGINEVPGFDPSDFGFTAKGVTQGFNDDLPLNSQESKYHLEGAMAHEFGHNLGYDHVINTNPAYAFVACGQPFSNPEIVNMGRYAIMDSWTGPTFPWMRPWSYHPRNLANVGWVDEETVWAGPCTTTVTIPDLRDPVNGKIVSVRSAVHPGQYFLLANVQGTGRDVDLGANGLLIWHMSSGGVSAWDLESARGKVPDPVNGDDPLEADACEFGAAGDIFDGSPGRDAFTPYTNPNTNFYENTYQSQPIVTGIHIANIRSQGTDMLVDIFLDQPPQVVSPVAGAYFSKERIAATGPFTGLPVQWISCASVMDIQLSDPTGTVFTTVADDIPNENTYTIHAVISPGDSYRVRVIPDNNPAAALTSGEFLVWDVVGPSIGPSGQDCQTDSIQVTSSWVLQPTVETVQQVTVYPASFSAFYTKTVTLNTFAPMLTLNIHNEPGTWYYNVTLTPTAWGPGAPEGQYGTFEVNGFIRPKGGEQFAVGGQPIPVQWYLCDASVVDVEISDPSGINFLTVADDIPNSGSYSLSPAGYGPGENYKIRIVPDNNYPAAIVSSPFTLWTIQNPVVTLSQSCVNQTVTFSASWQTSISLDASNVFLISSPTGQLISHQWSSEGSSHSWALTAPCEHGTWTWALTTTGGTPQGTEWRTGTRFVSCPPCPPGCRDCEFESSTAAVVVGQDKAGEISYLVKEFTVEFDAEITGASFVTGDDQAVFSEALLLRSLEFESPESRVAGTGPIGGLNATRLESNSGEGALFIREIAWEPAAVKAGEVLYLAIALPAPGESPEAGGTGIGASTSGASSSYVVSRETNDPIRLKEDLLIRLQTRDGAFIDAQKPAVILSNFLAPGVPNPFQAQVELRFGLAAPGHALLNVYDIAGALVRTVVDQELPAGEHRALWDGRDRHGRAASAGIYFMKLEHPTGTATQKLLRIR